ncbi:MAG: SpoIID/LytB domain-containing protein, partial [Rubrivivax sp.]|nr:SpoIID/LytB domain-containing protein [Pyrinomonadaceae bacterium]
MRSSFKNIYVATLLSCAIVFPSLILRAQDSGQPATRPRRATTDAWPAPTPDDVINTASEDETARITSEPVVRIGLAINARSVNISTSGRLLNATEPGADPVPFEVARVRVEPRMLPPLPAPNAKTDDEAPGIETASSTDAATRQPQASTRRPTAATTPGAKPSIQLTSRASGPSRGEVLYAPGSSKPLLDARAPVVFASDDEAQHPVRYNEKPYRGRLEVFANTRGTLTVVNVVALEDYVRGVVPNELSPGGWPELEALKAQAVAARTYTVSNIGRFQREGFDLTPDTRSQVYGGRATEHPFTDRAVSETRGRVATFKGVPINAFYTSTCGGRTEDAHNIFGGDAVPYLRGRECALESKEHFAAYTLRTTRELPSVKSAEHATSPRDAALLAGHGFAIHARLSDEWLAAAVTVEELRDLLGKVAALARQPNPYVTPDATRPGGFATALAAALDGESRGATLLNSADVEYLLAFRDAGDLAQQNRSDVAAMLREGHLSLFPDGTLRPRLPLSRARALRSIAHALEARNLLRL